MSESSDDECLSLSSPDVSMTENSDSDSDDDVFKCRSTKFQHVVSPSKVSASSSSPSASPADHKRKVSEYEKLAARNRKRQLSVQKKLASCPESDSSSSSDGNNAPRRKSTSKSPSNSSSKSPSKSSPKKETIIDIMGTTLTQAKAKAKSKKKAAAQPKTIATGRVTRSRAKSKSKTISQPSPPPAKRSPLPKSREEAIVDLMESSSDEESNHSVAIFTLKSQGVSKQAIDALQRSRRIAASLQHAQEYKAEDSIEVLDSDSDIDLMEETTFQTTKQDFGKTLQLVCRTMVEVNGKKQSSEQKDQVKLRQREPFRNLQAQLIEKYKLPPTARITFHFDGELLQPGKTPQDHDMEDEDLIDVQCKAIQIPLTSLSVNVPSNNATKNGMSTRGSSKTTARSQQSAEFGPALQLCLQRMMVVPNQRMPKVVQINIAHATREPFKQLLDKYRNEAKIPASTNLRLKFDGAILAPNTTPATHDMESGDLIDVVVG